MEFHHLPVLLNECLEGLKIREGGTYLDCTLGGAGHSSEILKRLHGGTLVGIDRDQDAIQAAMARLESLNADARFMALHGNFHDAKALLAGAGIARVDGILVDLGVSSHQLDVRERGFSYHDDAPLDMRMDVSQPLNACVIVNTYSENELTRIIRDYGEENWARQIARVICDRRKNAPIERTEPAGRDHRRGDSEKIPREGRFASGAPHFPGAENRGQRRAGPVGAGTFGFGGSAESGRKTLRDHIPFAGGSNRKKRVSDVGESVHVPEIVSGLRVREKAAH